MPNITMDDFIDECLTGKKPKRKKKVIEEKPTDTSSIFEADDDKEDDDKKSKKSVIDSKNAKEKTTKDDVEDLSNETEKTKDDETVLSFILNMNDKKKIKKYTKEEFSEDVPLNFQSILKQFGYDMDQISQKAQQAAPPVDSQLPEEPGSTEAGLEADISQDEPKFNKFRLSIREFITSGAGNEKVELSWRRDGEGADAIETAEVITSNGSMPFIDSPDPLNSAITTFDRIYYNDIVSKIRQELDWEESE